MHDDEWYSLSDEDKEYIESSRHTDNLWKTEYPGYRTSTDLWRETDIVELSFETRYGELGYKEAGGGNREPVFEDSVLMNYGSQFTCTLYAEAHDCSGNQQDRYGCTYSGAWNAATQLQVQGLSHIVGPTWDGWTGGNLVVEKKNIVIATKTFDKVQFTTECAGRQSFVRDDGISAAYSINNVYASITYVDSYCCVGYPITDRYTEHIKEYASIVSAAYEIYPQGTGNGYDAGFCLGGRSFVSLEYDAE